jgi:hypothetical protein
MLSRVAIKGALRPGTVLSDKLRIERVIGPRVDERRARGAAPTARDREGRYPSAGEMFGELSIVRARLEQSNRDTAEAPTTVATTTASAPPARPAGRTRTPKPKR